MLEFYIEKPFLRRQKITPRNQRPNPERAVRLAYQHQGVAPVRRFNPVHVVFAAGTAFGAVIADLLVLVAGRVH